MKYCLIAAAILSSIQFLTTEAIAEFDCGSSVSYAWEYQSETPSHSGMKESEQDMKDSDEKKMENNVMGEPQTYTILFSTRNAKGMTEEEAKKYLQKLLERDVSEARAECKRLHENLSGCVSTKFLSMNTVLRQLGFSARKKLEESIQKDCEMQTGRCTKVESAKIECKEIVAAAPEGEEEEGDDKKKKKKK